VAYQKELKERENDVHVAYLRARMVESELQSEVEEAKRHAKLRADEEFVAVNEQLKHAKAQAVEFQAKVRVRDYLHCAHASCSCVHPTNHTEGHHTHSDPFENGWK
jgi:hypothetical protein